MIELVIVLAVGVIGIIACELDSFVGGGFTLIALLASAQLWFGIPVGSMILATPVLAVLALIVYVAVGLAYAVLVRFPRFLRASESSIEAAWVDFKRNNPGQDVTQADFHKNYRFRPFTARENDVRITSWAMLWPWGLAWDVTNRPVRAVYRQLAVLCSGVLDRAERRAINTATKKGP